MDHGVGLLDRRSESEAIDRVLEAVRNGLSGTLVVRGDAGIGKTALVDHAMAGNPDLRFDVVAGIESELELGFAGLHQLLLPYLSLLESIPAPQGEALQAAFGLGAAQQPDRFLIGLGALSLLARAAEDGPLVCIVDDAQWLDVESSEALAFVARRLLADRVGLIVVLREEVVHGGVWERFDTLHLEALPDADACALLGAVVDGPLPDHVVERILLETTRNPLGVVELAGELSAAELTERASLPTPLPLSRRVEARFLRQVRALSPDAQSFLLLAAADSTTDPSRLRRAAASIGLDSSSVADGVEQTGLLESGASVRFRHPLVRSAIYHGATDIARRRAHLALADISEGDPEADLRAWHRGAAAVEPDDELAAELERAAERVHARGGYAARAALLRRAAELTADDASRAERELAVAEAELNAGNFGTARDVVDRALPRLAGPTLRGLARRVQGSILVAARSFLPGLGSVERGCRHSLPRPRLARDAIAAASEAAILAGPRETRDVARIAGALPARPGQPAVAP